MFKGLIDKGKCKLGFHSGEWKYNRPKECLQVRICERCGTRSEKVEHTWGDWHYQQPGACDLIRLCTHCGEKEARIEHTWSDPRYKSARKCTLVSVCTRCGEEKAAGERHTWSDPRYKSAGRCTLVIACTRCGEEKAAGERHTWGGWNYLNAEDCRQGQQCTRCAARSPHERVGHNWEAWQNSAFYGSPVRACRHCGEAEVQVDATGKSVTLQAIHTHVLRLTESLTDADQMRAALQSDQNLLLLEVTGRYLRLMAEAYPGESQARKGVEAVQIVRFAARKGGVEATVQAMFAQPPAVPAQEAPVTPPAPAKAAAPAARTQGSLPKATHTYDPLLIGHWICTDSMTSSILSIVTDHHMVFTADGQMFTYSHTVSSMRESRTQRELFSWYTNNGILSIIDSVGDSVTSRYEVSRKNLLFPDSSENFFWERA